MAENQSGSGQFFSCFYLRLLYYSLQIQMRGQWLMPPAGMIIEYIISKPRVEGSHTNNMAMHFRKL